MKSGRKDRWKCQNDIFNAIKLVDEREENSVRKARKDKLKGENHWKVLSLLKERENRQKEQSGGEAANSKESEGGRNREGKCVNKWTDENINIRTRKYVNKEKDKKLKI